ncbi:MAG: hypothetical protein AAF604_11955 [Acidobacteriota bacterium]
MTDTSACPICAQPLENADCKLCPNCNSPLHGFDGWAARNGTLVSLLRYVATALLVPFALWIVSSTYSSREQERDAIARKHDEVSKIMPRTAAAIDLLQDPCLNNKPATCLDRIDEGFAEYVRATQELEATVTRNFPHLQPTSELLASLQRDLAIGISRVWSEYRDCTESRPTLTCVEEIRKQPFPQLAVAHFLIDFLHCAVHEELSESGVFSDNLVCRRTIERHREIALERPTRIIEKFEGAALRPKLAEIAIAIWCEEMVPSTGWDDRGLCS